MTMTEFHNPDEHFIAFFLPGENTGAYAFPQWLAVLALVTSMAIASVFIWVFVWAVIA